MPNDPNWSSSDNWKGDSDATIHDTGPNGPQSGDDYIYYEATSFNDDGPYYLTSSVIRIKFQVLIFIFMHMEVPSPI